MTEREELESDGFEQQRAVLVDDAVEAALADERRVVTVLFCDVKGSTAMAEKLDSEE